MFENGLVSIIIPCYNQAQFLGETIESVLKQTYKNYEIIVVNDGSTDITTEVAKSFPNVRLIEQYNVGLAYSRNNGLVVSRGEFIVFLDSDDRLLPDALEIGIQAHKNHANCAFVSGLCQTMTLQGEYLPIKQPELETSDYYLELLQFSYIWCPSNVMYRREIFEEIGGFDATISPAADYEIYLRIARLFPVYHHGHIVSEYRQHNTSMSHDFGLMLKTVLRVLHAQKKFVKTNKHFQNALKRGISSYKYYYLECVCGQVIRSLKSDNFLNALNEGSILLRYPTKLPKLLHILIRDKFERKHPTFLTHVTKDSEQASDKQLK